MSRNTRRSIFNMQQMLRKLSVKKIGVDRFLSTQTTKFSQVSLLGILLATGSAYALPVDDESGVFGTSYEDVLAEDDFRNDQGVLMSEEEIKLLKGQYISPYNYLQDPVEARLGYSAVATSPNGTYRGGFSAIAGQNRPVGSNNMTFNTDIAQFWGQTGRLGGFALGGAVTATTNFNNGASVNTFTTVSQFTLSQAYLNYQYSNKVDVSAGNIILNTPWVNSFGSQQGGTYALGTNPYQGAVINVQALPSLLVTAYTAVGYMPYPNNWFGPQNYYNTMGGILKNSQPTSGTTGVGLNWNPVKSYTGQLWLYNFADYANMAYINNAYHVDISRLFSMDFGAQAFTQTSSGSSIPNQVLSPNQTTTLGNVSSNGLGLKMGLNIGPNTTSISFNNIFGRNGSYLNGGMVSPYSFGMEIDPLYTTPALTSLAELGSGWAYTLRNSTSFMNNSLKYSLSMSQFFVNQVYASQVSQVTEYDSSILYRIPHTNMNVWGRLVYLQQPSNYGGDMWQPRVIFNWTY